MTRRAFEWVETLARSAVAAGRPTSDVSGVCSARLVAKANGSNDMLSAKNLRSSRLVSRASLLNVESVSEDEVNVGEEKPDVDVRPLAPLSRRPSWSSVALSINDLYTLDVAKPRLIDAASTGCGNDERFSSSWMSA